MDDGAIDTLQAIFPAHDSATLKRFLAASNGNIERAVQALLQPDALVSHNDSGGKRAVKRRKVEKLDGWLKGSKEAKKPVKSLPPSSVQPSSSNLEPLKSAFALMKPSAYQPEQVARSSSASTPQPPLAANLPPLRLTTAEQIANHTHGMITLIHNVLPVDLANRLYLRMVEESQPNEQTGNPGWERNRWFLVDREVESPHTSAFFVEKQKQGNDSKSAYDEQAFEQAASHWYNGEKRSAQPFLDEMDEARELIGSLVRTVLSTRERHPLEWQGDWQPNVAAANCYRGAKESVGWHSDVLTHLGPYPTIASLSLGTERPFRLRPFTPSMNSTVSLPKRTLELVLPHNSLCIMHAGCQETFKHTVPPVSAMDVFKVKMPSKVPGEEPEIRKFRERINMTFRHYRADFAPLPPAQPPSLAGSGQADQHTAPKAASTYTGTVLCHCGIPTTLRPDARGRAKAKLSTNGSPSTTAVDQDQMLFFWTCSAGMQNEGKTCGFWKLLDMKREGRGRYFVPP